MRRRVLMGLLLQMARMVATKAALSIRVDALADVDTKSEPQAATIGIENRAKLESRLRALEYRNDLNGTGRGDSSWKKQQRFEMTGETKQYNTAADSVNITMKPVGDALDAIANGEGEKKKSKEERKKEKEEKKARRKSGISTADVEEGTKMDVDGDDEEETEEQRKARKKAKKEAKKAAAAAASAPASPEKTKVEEPSESKKSKKRRASEAADETVVDTDKKKKKKKKSEE